MSLGLILLIASSALALNCNYCVSLSLAFELPLDCKVYSQYNNLPLMHCKLCDNCLPIQNNGKTARNANHADYANFALIFFQFRMIVKTARNAPPVIQKVGLAPVSKTCGFLNDHHHD